MSKILGTYVNGNTIVVMHEDGTKERYIKDGEKGAPEFPESMDLKITNRCDLGCPMCAECSSPDGEHADLRHPIFNTINPYTELAIGGGNPLEHPDLVWFLLKMQRRKVICNLTINVVHFMRDDTQYKLKLLTEQGAIHGLGISVPDQIPDGFLDTVKRYPNAVIHTIAGVTPPLVFDQLADHSLNLLILGYKTKGKGYQCSIDNEQMILDRIYGLEQRLPWLKKHFKAVAFDNLAVRQMNLRKNLPGEDYDKLYMGDDGEFTMYIDMVQKKFGKSSTHYLHPIDFDMAPAVGNLFLELKESVQMESPFYEMTHDYEEENRIALSSYNNGYANGYLDGFNKQQERISEQLNEIVILQTQIQNFKTMLKMQEPVEPEIHMEDMSLRKDPELTFFCGACGGEMVHKYSDYLVDVVKERYKYCHHCGRKVLWK